MFKGNRILVRHNKSSSYPGFELSGVYSICKYICHCGSWYLPRYPHHRESWLISHELWKLANKSESLSNTPFPIVRRVSLFLEVISDERGDRTSIIVMVALSASHYSTRAEKFEEVCDVCDTSSILFQTALLSGIRHGEQFYIPSCSLH